ncbi:ribonuclease J [Aeribacillus sp. FSL K6-8394]|uniref:ribonuclease J n=1 Tax=Aeribacillus sp. FSL K6-8394 TaxID=2954570 RepID=UPI0030FC45A3
MKKAEKIQLIALGGVGEVGKNLYIVKIDSDIFIVDAGLKYPENEMLGIDVVIPDITYLLERKDRVRAIFLTNGRLDRIGAIFYILKHINAPVYGTKWTIALTKERMKQYSVTADFREVNMRKPVHFPQVTVSFFRTFSNIPDSMGVCFHTSMGAIVHTGDFKLEQSSIGSHFLDFGKMAEIGNSGVLCLLSDSINAERPGFSGSEALAGEMINDVMYNSPGRVVVSVAETNIYRIQQIFNAAVETGRKIAIIGKSFAKIIELARQLRYLKADDDLFIPVSHLKKLEKQNSVLLCASDSFDPLAEISKMAKGIHKQHHITSDDTVLIAQTPTPGQELIYSKTIDLLFRAGANVVSIDKKAFFSGHGCQEELKLMLHLMKPKYFIPVHGEFKMQIAHAKIAQSIGIREENIFLLDQGDVVEFTPKSAKTVTKVPSGNVLIDGLGVGDVGNIVLRDRRLLSQDGILIVVVTLNKEMKKIVAGPEIISRGFVYVRESESLISKATKMVHDTLSSCMEDVSMDWSTMKQNIRDVLNQFLYEQTKRRPMILPIIMEV